MSLINDALKKAQKQRAGETPPLASLPNVGGGRAAPVSRGRSNTPSGLYIGLGLGAVAVVGLIIAAILLFRGNPPAPVATRTAETPTTASQPSAPARNEPSAPAAKPSESMFVVPIATPAPKPEPVETAAAGPAPAGAQPSAATAPAPSPAVETPAPAPAIPGRMDSRAIQFIDGIKVAGIRASAADSKVLMNDRVFRVGDTVGYELGIRLVGITASSLTFEDAHGARYTRNF